MIPFRNDETQLPRCESFFVLIDTRRVLQHVAAITSVFTRRDHPAETKTRWYVGTHTCAVLSSLEGPPATSGTPAALHRSRSLNDMKSPRRVLETLAAARSSRRRWPLRSSPRGGEILIRRFARETRAAHMPRGMMRLNDDQ